MVITKLWDLSWRSTRGAGISSKHVLALCNADNATAQEIIELAKKAHKAVKETFGITLTPEVRLIGLTLD